MNTTPVNKKVASALLGIGIVGASFGISQVAFAQDLPETGADAVASAFQEAETETDGLDGEDHRRDGRRSHGGCNLETAADAIGITSDALRAELESGATIASVAEANGISADAVVEALLTEASDRIDAKVAAGDMTAEEGSEKLASKIARIQEQVFSARGDGPAA